MAEEQKNVEVPKDLKVEETAPVVADTTKVEATETKPSEETAAPAAETATAETTEDKPAEEAKPAEAEEAKAEEKKEEVKPVEEGHLGHKAQGLSFPKNLIASKEFFFFGVDAFEPKALAVYQRTEKSAETAHTNIAWASETGKGLLFIGDKKAPTGIINLSDASEPENDGTHKFTLTSKGNKHSFKAASAAERDNWVAQLKLKIAEAKELATTIVEAETYKKTLESFKPAPPKKEEKPVEAPKEEAPVEEAAKTEEAPKTEEAKEEKAEKAESPKPLKTKRTSFFGFNFKKDEHKDEKKEKKEEPKVEENKAEEAPKVEETPAAPAPGVEETPKVEEAAPAEEAAAPVEDKPTEEAKPAESPKEKASKRNSFFGNVFSKKEKKATEPKAAEPAESPKEEVAPTTESAPVIPPVESTTPLAVDVNSPATVPTETTEAAPANGETRKETKEKRKSSLPFLGKREKSPAPAEGEEKDKSPLSAFSKIRATIKGKTTHKSEEKPAEETVKEEVKEENAKETATEEAPKVDEAPKIEEPAKPSETETKPENVASAAPAVTAAA